MSAAVELLERLKPAFRSPKSGLFKPKKTRSKIPDDAIYTIFYAESTDCGGTIII
jgi:hypothetical protein